MPDIADLTDQQNARLRELTGIEIRTEEQQTEYQELWDLRRKYLWEKSAAEPRFADALPMVDCKPRHLYRIASRNLTLGVYDGKEGFIGIRLKWKRRYLFTEYHWDQGPPYGTVNPKEDLGLMPEDIKCQESFDFDKNTERPIYYDSHVTEGGRGWVYVDTHEPADECQPYFTPNQALFDWLDEQV